MTRFYEKEVKELLDELDKLPRANVMRFYPYQILYRYECNESVDTLPIGWVTEAIIATRHLLDYLGEA